MITGQFSTFAIPKLTTWRVSADALGVGQVWFVGENRDGDALAHSIASDTDTLLGPYASNCNVRIECHEGSLTVQQLGVGTVPSLFTDLNDIVKTGDDPVSQGAAVADPADDTEDHVALLALLASLRASGAILTEEI